ncbi:HD domain-containing protein [Fusibacter ferrireducens]|uniref:HD domain-containing protein n=1 Tax=Fusibacter ferrireducens TaxID=2785058 RepID=A0ABR9ZYB5_9FIRM|nr:HD domain-containing protein [Fusibacter ferrireducens]MBF4695453.1 HD domain-containing protein [Fusibacter ferrireducens]
MNYKRDSIKKSIIKFLIKYITLLVLVLLCANITLYGIFCIVSNDNSDRGIRTIDLKKTPLKAIMDEIEYLSYSISNNNASDIREKELKNELFLEALVTSDSNIVNAYHAVRENAKFSLDREMQDDANKNSEAVVEKTSEIMISAPHLEANSGIEVVTFSKPIWNLEGTFLGEVMVDYRYDVFKASVLSTVSKSNRIELIYTEALQYAVMEHYSFFTQILDALKNQFIQTLLMILLLSASCYVFVAKSYETLKQLVLDLDRNYRKNIHGTCLIEEYHIIMASLDEIKEDIDLKLLEISELKVIESELIQETRYKNKQFEELYKNHTVLKNRDLYLKSLFKTVSENIEQMIWLMDTEGQIIYVNQALAEILKNEPATSPCDHINDFIEGFDMGVDLLSKRDYKSIKFTFKNQIFKESLNGGSVRIREFNRVRYILCFCSKSNFEDKMNQNYLKKSRDLHFINEIGKIISVNNSIESTLQDILDKVAFLANLNLNTIRLINENQKLELKTVSGYSNKYILEKEAPIEGRHMGYCFKENKIIIINGEEDLLFRELVLEKILNEGRSVAYIPLANYQKSFGVMSIISDFKFNTDYIILLESISINVTISLEKVLLYDQLKANYYKTVEAFVTAAEIKQERFSGHSRRVARICRLIAQRLYLNDNEIDDIYIAGLLHDIGKLGFADNSLEYFFDIDEHGVMGRKMIENVGFNKEILKGIEFHHLNYDLSNQPVDLQEQPYYSQIIRLANDFDLFMNYNSGNHDKHLFLKKMTTESGTVYSPQLLKILEDLICNKNKILEAIYDFKTLGEQDEN